MVVRRQVEVSACLLLLAAICHLLTTGFHIKRDSVGEKEIAYRASGYAGYVCACDRQAQTSHQDAHKNQIAGY